MKAKTLIVAACKSMYDAYTDYSRIVVNIPVIPSVPKVSWVPGSTKGGKAGWLVDGRLYPGTAAQVVAHFNERAVFWEDKARRHSDPAPKDGDK